MPDITGFESNLLVLILTSLVGVLGSIVVFFLNELYRGLKRCMHGVNEVQRDIAVIKALISNFGLSAYKEDANGHSDPEIDRC